MIASELGRLQARVAEQGRCATVADPESFWVATDSRKGAKQAAQRRYAARLCAGCPVLEDCHRYAVDAGEWWGVWGGTTEHDRRQLIRAQLEAAS